MSDIQIHDDTENHRYVISVAGEPAGMAVYHIKGDRYFFVHTETSPEYRGEGLASKLATFALDDMRDRGELIVPLCPFIAAFVRRHPEYQDLVDQEMLDQINAKRQR